MDDEKRYTIQIKGQAYRFRPIPPEDIERVNIIINMNASHAKTFKGLTRVLSKAAGPEQWDELTDLLVEEKVTLEEITTNVLRRLIERQVKDAKAAKEDATAADAE